MAVILEFSHGRDVLTLVDFGPWFFIELNGVRIKRLYSLKKGRKALEAEAAARSVIL